MTRCVALPAILLLLGLFVQAGAGEEPAADAPGSEDPQGGDEDGDWALNSLRGSFESIGGYFDSMLEFMGGRDGVCQYRCRYGEQKSQRVEDSARTGAEAQQVQESRGIWIRVGGGGAYNYLQGHALRSFM